MINEKQNKIPAGRNAGGNKMMMYKIKLEREIRPEDKEKFICVTAHEYDYEEDCYERMDFIYIKDIFSKKLPHDINYLVIQQIYDQLFNPTKKVLKATKKKLKTATTYLAEHENLCQDTLLSYARKIALLSREVKDKEAQLYKYKYCIKTLYYTMPEDVYNKIQIEKTNHQIQYLKDELNFQKQILKQNKASSKVNNKL